MKVQLQHMPSKKTFQNKNKLQNKSTAKSHRDNKEDQHPGGHEEILCDRAEKTFFSTEVRSRSSVMSPCNTKQKTEE